MSQFQCGWSSSQTTTDRRLGEPLPHQLANQISAAPLTQGPKIPCFPPQGVAVLANISISYPPLLDTFRYITHPFATRHQEQAPVLPFDLHV